MNKEIATLAGGCFWCTEAIFNRLKGVLSVSPGYTGGVIKNPSYEQVCSGTTGHTEAIQIEFNPAVISFSTLLDIFFHTHDPTTLNQQGNDIGTQYRSAIFYHNDTQKKTAESIINIFSIQKFYPRPIVTELVPFTDFYVAENYHHDYYEQNKNQSYCSMIISPKIKKLLVTYSDKIK